MMKPIVFVFTTAYHPFIGGVEIAIQEVAERLGKQFRFFIVAARMRRDLAARELRPEGVIRRIGFGSTIDKWFLPFLGAYAAVREIRRIKSAPVLLWGMDISAGALAASLVKWRFPRIPFVFSIQYGYGNLRLGHGRLGMILRAFRFMLRRADTVTAISRYLADMAQQFGYKGTVAVVPNGVAVERFMAVGHKSKAAVPPLIITVSRLVPKNGVDTLIRAIAQLRNYATAQLDVKLHILGDGPERFSLEALARSLGLGKHVTFFGNVPNVEVPRYLVNADIFVRPSRSEGMGNVFVEALAAGIPIIGTPVGGITDIIQDGKTGLFCKVDDPKDLADKISKLLADQTLARQIVENGKRMVEERFSWDQIVVSYRRIFAQSLVRRFCILIAAPQFPPDIGGPGGYAEKLADNLLAQGCKVSILCYGPKRNLTRFDLVNVTHGLPSGLKHFVYFFKAFKMLLKSDVALVLDPVIVGFPVTLASRLASKPMTIRVEGDFLWEWFSERTKKDLTLWQFYEKFGEQKSNLKERLMHTLARFVFSQARYLVFSSPWRKDIFQLGYPLKSKQAVFISPPWPARPRLSSPASPEASRGRAGEAGEAGRDKAEREKVILFAGRFIHIKNIPRLIRSFLAAAPPDWQLILIGDGPERPAIEAIIREAVATKRIHILPPLARDDLMEKIAEAHAFLLPSLSEVSPNVILDCLRAGTPFLLTRETGFYEALKDIGVFVDPQDEEDIKEKLRLLFDPKLYAAYRRRLENFKKTHSWSEVTEEWLKLLRFLV